MDPVILRAPDAPGSVQHFYHFLLGYFLPLVQWVARERPSGVVVRDCGPMNPWFDLLRSRVRVAVVGAEVQARLAARPGSPTAVLDRTDRVRAFHPDLLHDFVRAFDEVTGLLRPLRSEPQALLVVRGAAPAFYSTAAAEIPTAAAERRSLPNAADVATAVNALLPTRLLDLADLAPADQVHAVAGVRVLVGQHGAGLAHMLWLPASAAVVEILPPVPGRSDLFRRLAQGLGLAYAAVPQLGPHAPVTPEWVAAGVRSALSAGPN